MSCIELLAPIRYSVARLKSGLLSCCFGTRRTIHILTVSSVMGCGYSMLPMNQRKHLDGSASHEGSRVSELLPVPTVVGLSRSPSWGIPNAGS